MFSFLYFNACNFLNVFKKFQVVRTDAVHSVWLTIPKLSEICWQALIHYCPDLRHKSQDELLHMGIPLKFVQRIDWYDA